MAKKTKKPTVQTDDRPVPSNLTPDVTTQSSEPNVKKEKEGDDFFSNGKSLS